MNVHLTKDEIIDFILMRKLDNEALELARRVNSHIINCADCFRLVKAFQTVQTEFEQCESAADFSAFVAERYVQDTEEENYAEL